MPPSRCHYHHFHLFVLSVAFNTIFLLLQFCPSAVQSKRLRALGEPCREEPPQMKCAPGLECAAKGNGGKQRCRAAVSAADRNGENGNQEGGESGHNHGNGTTEATDQSPSKRCLSAKCPMLFPDCPPDSVPMLSTGPVSIDPDQCCPPALVQCRCDPQKCLVPACFDGSERVLRAKGTNRSGHCCDQFECRQSEANCQNIHCPEDSSNALFDLYSSDGHACPDDSYRPEPYIPAGACCPIVPQCQCRLGICEPARCSLNEKLVIERRGHGEPGKCCDQYKCVPMNEDGLGRQLVGGAGCKHKGHIYAVGERWHAALCQECQCSAAGIALCRRMECPALTGGCQWIGLSPGECCPVCLGCRDEQGRNYMPGEHWEKDGCTNCTCGADFRLHCQKFICQTNCENPRPVPDQCCPVCDQPSIAIEPAASCPSHADCPLRCEFGLLQDQWTGCFECQCANGTSLVLGIGTGDGHESQSCAPLTVANCLRLCAHGYLHDEQTGCPQCRCAHCPPMLNCGKICVHGWETNWMGCPICKCRPSDANNGGEAHGQTVGHARSSSGLLPLQRQNSSLHCMSKSSERDVGEWWTEGCRQCFCQHGKEFCSLLACPARPPECPDELWSRFSDDCCPRCAHPFPTILPLPGHSGNSTPALESVTGQQVCHSPGTGQVFVDGQTWHLAEDHCLACTCRMGHVLCVWNDGRQCSPTPCEQPVMNLEMDRCCPSCPSAEPEFQGQIPPADDGLQSKLCTDNSTGTAYPMLAEWRRDECQSCRCDASGEVQCFREHCNSTCTSGRLLSLKGRCCPVCSDSLDISTCQYDGRVYGKDEQFQDGPCRNCTCLSGGLLKCLEMHCLPCSNIQEGDMQTEVADNKTVTDGKNRCCPVCKTRSDVSDASQGEVLYSSFEKGTEQTIFIESTRQQERENNFGQNDREGLIWLFAIVISAASTFCLLSIGMAYLVIKCRRKKMKWTGQNSEIVKNENGNRNLVHWHSTFPNRGYEKRPYTTKTKQDIVASMSLLKLNEEKLQLN